MNPECFGGPCGTSEPDRQFCKAFVDNTVCGETDSLEILDKVHNIYANRVKEIDCNVTLPEADRTSIKLQVMEEWITDLGDQNKMLVRTVQDLEKAAAQRVQILERKLQQSSLLVSEKALQSNQSEELEMLSKKIQKLEEKEQDFKKRTANLESDIRNLIELIKRGLKNKWSLGGLKFFEIDPDSIMKLLQEHYNEGIGDGNHVQYNVTLEKLQENEQRLIEHQRELENKLHGANKTIENQKKLLEKCFGNSKKLTKIGDAKLQTAETNDEVDSGIGSVTEIAERTCGAVNIEFENLNHQLEDANFQLTKLMHENSRSRIHLEEKSKRIIELESRLAALEAESSETTSVLTAEVAEKFDEVVSLRKEICNLEEKCQNFNKQLRYKDENIKELKKDAKKSCLKESGPRKVRINDDVQSEEGNSASLNLSDPIKNEILFCLCNIKADIEKEKDYIFKLKQELERLEDSSKRCEGNQVQEPASQFDFKYLQDLETLLREYKSRIIKGSVFSESVKRFFTLAEDKIASLQNSCSQSAGSAQFNVKEEAINIISNVRENSNKIYLEKERTIVYLKYLTKLANSKNVTNETKAKESINDEVHNAMRQQFKLMEEFRICTVEAQAAVEDLHEETESVISNFNNQHEKYIKLNIVVDQVRDYLIKSKESISQVIQKLESQEEERKRHTERITHDKNRLKDLKNNANQTRVHFSLLLKKIQENVQACDSEAFFETHVYDNLLNPIEAEIDRIVSDVDVFQSQSSDAVQILIYLKDQLSTVECSLQNLQQSSTEVCQENQIAQQVFLQRQNKMEKLEEELDCTHTRMQDVLENILDNREKMNRFGFVKGNDTSSEEIKEYIKMKTDMQKLRKECEGLKIKLVEEESKIKQYDSVNELRLQFKDMQNQVEFFKNEIKGKQEANNMLKMNIDSIEKELLVERTNAESHRKLYLSKNAELNRKLFESEKTIRERFQTQAVSTANIVAKCGNNAEPCSPEFEDLKGALMSKDKLLGDKEEIIKIQNDSIAIMQSEMNEVHKKLQEQIDSYDTTVAQNKEDKKNLIKQNDLQAQTIGHLQDAVVDAKKCIDQMGHKAVSDNLSNKETIQALNIYLSEVQDQYINCFAEAAKQDTLLELQRSAVESLQNEISNMEYCECVLFVLLYLVYYFVMHSLQRELQSRINQCQLLKSKLETLNSSHADLKQKYDSLNATWRRLDQELTELKRILHKKSLTDTKSCQSDQLVSKDFGSCTEASYFRKEQSTMTTEELVEYIFFPKMNELAEVNEKLKKQLEKFKFNLNSLESDLENERAKNLVIEELKLKLSESKRNENCLMLESEDLRENLEILEKKMTKETTAEESQTEFPDFEKIVMQQTRIIEDLKDASFCHENRAKNLWTELKESKDFLSFLRRKISFLEKALREKSVLLAKLQVDSQMLQNDNSILKVEKNAIENKAKESIQKLKTKKNEILLEICIIKDDCERITAEYHQNQELLIKAAKREIDLQQVLINKERKFHAKIVSAEKEESRLRDQLTTLQNDVYCMKHKIEEFEESNCFLRQQLQQYEDKNVRLFKQSELLEYNNSRRASQLEDMQKSFRELQNECQVKNKSLASMSADLKQTAISRSELCSESRYVLSCIRDWMENQKKSAQTLVSKLKTKQQQFVQVLREKRELLFAIEEQKFTIDILKEQVEHFHKPLINRAIKMTSNKCLKKARFVRRVHKKSTSSWRHLKLERMTKKLQECNRKWKERNELISSRTKNEPGLDECRDCGYQSSASK